MKRQMMKGSEGEEKDEGKETKEDDKGIWSKESKIKMSRKG